MVGSGKRKFNIKNCLGQREKTNGALIFNIFDS